LLFVEREIRVLKQLLEIVCAGMLEEQVNIVAVFGKEVMLQLQEVLVAAVS